MNLKTQTLESDFANELRSLCNAPRSSDFCTSLLASSIKQIRRDSRGQVLLSEALADTTGFLFGLQTNQDKSARVSFLLNDDDETPLNHEKLAI